MAYKYTRGSVKRGDIYNEDDAQGNTYLDWNEDAIGFVTSGSTAMIVSGSKVGIGTSTPAYTLDVQGHISIGTTGTAYIINNNDTNTHIKLGGSGVPGLDGMTFTCGNKAMLTLDENGLDTVTVGTTGDATDFKVMTANTDYALYVSGGTDRVGIGTSTPDHELTVAGNVSASINISASSFYGDGSNLTGISGGGSTDPGGSDGQIQYNNGGAFGGDTNLHWDDTNDRLGVGTTSPLSMLSVNGSLSVATTYVQHNSGTGVYTLNVDDSYFHLDCECTNGDIHIQLPTLASSTGRIYSVKKIYGGYSAYIKAQSGEYIDDTVPGSVQIPTNGMCVIIISAQGRWRTIAKLSSNA